MNGSEVVDFADPAKNMYGCAPCPECGGEFTFARAGDLVIVCDDCTCEEQGVRAEDDA